MVTKSFLNLFSVAGLVGVVSVSAANIKRTACPDGINFATNSVCCPFYTLRDDLMANLFTDGCSEAGHECLRLTFHDAMGYSQTLVDQGQFGGTGADGSFLLFPQEETFKNNEGISSSVDDLMPFFNRHNVSAGDLIQFAGAVALTSCPGAPRLQFLSGRVNAVQPPPDGLTPSPVDSADVLLARLKDAGGFTPDEVVALLSAHSIGRADLVDPTTPDAPFDTTPFTFDTQFFMETLLKPVGYPGTGNNPGEAMSPLPQHSGMEAGELRLASDQELAQDPRTACAWQALITDQAFMASQFKAAMGKMAVIGQDTTNMVDCSEAIPEVVKTSVKKSATYPATKTAADIVQSCMDTPFPSLSADPGPASFIPHCPNDAASCT